ncbi:DEAD-box ATP-dependent RNA helicase 22-like [Rutidosis leptorrhynchoides]|uniref:DEAD-box ATP-dependent RNA helicase 22-like n=1 Tax=Rutidosis leptorrhynchoides TaxID=125765 RepID=UPI003A9A6382
MILQRSTLVPILNLCRSSTSPKFVLLRPNPPFKLSSFSLLTSQFHHRPRCRIRAFSTSVEKPETTTDTFFSDETVTWSSLGITNDKLSQALSNIGFNRPSLIQAASIPAILYGNDVVVAAETGSGKTHGYLAPLFHKQLLSLSSSDNTSTNKSDDKVNKPHHISLVLCPNVMLCEQVVRMANSICNDNGEPLLRVAAVCGRQGWPINKPNIIVSTPAALLNYLHAIDPERRRRAEFIRDVKHVVFDEADMLLCGSFQNQVIRLINMFRFDEKVLSRAKNSPGDKPLMDMESAESSLMQIELEDDEDTHTNSIPEDDEESDNDDEHSLEESQPDKHNLKESQPVTMKKRDWKRAREIYERSKQYIFVAATLPENGKRTAGGELKRLFPDATWVSGLYLHRHNPRLEQKWIEVTVDSQVNVLIEAVNHTKTLALDNGLSRTMVFANTVEAVEAIAQVLNGASIECYCYHSESSLEERTRNLVEFQEKGGIFVCTDAAARGTDIPNVSHVIQAEFATSAVDFLHRVGRTARAGQPGLVTSMYSESNRDLVAAVRQAGKVCEPVEKAFSRKRSFRKKLKKRGRDGRNTVHVQDRIAA